jgi:hypothetical protein
MKRHLILATEPLQSSEEAQLLQSIGTPYYWHWIPNFWLLVDYTGAVTVTSLRDAVARLNPKVQCLALEVDPVTWAAMSRGNAQGVAHTDWISQSWKRE